MEKVGIVVLNYKNYEDTIECLDSLFAMTYPDYEVIVVDNDSKNDSLTFIAKALNDRNEPFVRLEEATFDSCIAVQTKTILFQSPSNRGYAAGNNWGIRVALMRKAEYILILNNDTCVHKGFLLPLVTFAIQHADVAILGPKVLNLDGEIERACARRRTTYIEYFFRLGIIGQMFKNNWAVKRHYYVGDYKFDEPREVDMISGCCMLMKSCALQRIGLLDENTFLNLEEFILCEKLRRETLRTFIVPDSVIIHKHGGSISKVSSDFVRNASRESLRYYLTRYRGFSSWVAAVLMCKLPPMRSIRKYCSSIFTYKRFKGTGSCNQVECSRKRPL